MAVLSLLVVAGIAYSAVVWVLTSRTYFAVSSNKPFAREWPDIDPPLWRVALRHIAALLSTVLWLVRWPSVTEVWMAFCLVPLLFVPYPLILNNMLEWVMYLIFGNAQGDGSHKDSNTGLPSSSNGAPPLRWPPTTLLADLWDAVRSAVQSINSWLAMMWNGRTWRPSSIVNYNHSLLCYLQNESWDEMHHLDSDILEDFPTDDPNSRANAVMMARCATMSYDRWHNIDQAVSLKWNDDLKKGLRSSTTPNKFSLLKAWSFDRVTVPSTLEPLPTANNNTTLPFSTLKGLQKAMTAAKKWVQDTILKGIQRVVWWLAVGEEPDKPVYDDEEFTSINTDAFLMKVVADKPDPKTGHNVVALVLAFRGTEALQTVDWVSDLAQVAPPPYALDPTYFALGFTHQGFRDSLGLMRDLKPADNLEKRTIGKRFTSSYLVYEPSNNSSTPGTTFAVAGIGAAMAGTGAAMAGSSAAIVPWKPGSLTRLPVNNATDMQTQPGPQPQQESPYTVITREIEQAIVAMGPNTTVKVFVTGHSLGGALAHLYTGALLLRQPASSPAVQSFEGVYTFGEPRVGDQTWVSLVEEKLRKVKGPGGVAAEDRFKRVVNTLDIVTRIPPPLGELYQHPGHCTFIKPHFAIARPAETRGTASRAAAVLTAAAAPDDTTQASISTFLNDAADRIPDSMKVAAAAGDAIRNDVKNDQKPEPGSKPQAQAAAAATPAPAARVSAFDSSYSPTANLNETPDVFLGTTVLTVLLKLALSVLLLLSATVLQVAHKYGWPVLAAVAIVVGLVSLPVSLAVLTAGTAIAAVAAVTSVLTFVLWPSLYDAIISPVLKELQVSVLMLAKSLKQGVDKRPRLTYNPVYLITRLFAFLGPAPIVLLLDTLLLPVFAVFTPIMWWTVFTEPVLLGALFVLMPPCIIGGLVDHSMAEYYTACWLTTDADWKTATTSNMSKAFKDSSTSSGSASRSNIPSSPDAQKPHDSNVAISPYDQLEYPAKGLSSSPVPCGEHMPPAACDPPQHPPAISTEQGSVYYGDSLARFGQWLKADSRPMLMLDGEWLGSLADAQPYVDCLAESGFFQVAETAEGMLLMTHAGCAAMHRKCLDAYNHNGDVAYSNPVCAVVGSDPQDNATQSKPDQQRSCEATASSSSSHQTPDVREEAAGSSEDNQGESDGDPIVIDQANSDPPISPSRSCYVLSVASDDWTDSGLQATSRVQHHGRVSTPDTPYLTTVFSTTGRVNIKVQLQVEACYKGDKDKIVGFKVRQVLASVKAQPGQIGFMRSVKVSIAAQCPNGRSLNTSCVNASDKLDTGVVEKNMTYKYKERVYKVSVTAALKAFSAVLGVDLAEKEQVAAKIGETLPRVSVDLAAEAVPAAFDRNSSTVSLEVVRHTLPTLLCGGGATGVINSNPGNTESKKWSFGIDPHRDYPQAGSLQNAEIHVKLALEAVGGIIGSTELTRPKGKPSVMEVELLDASSITAGATFKIGRPVRPLHNNKPGCRLHTS